MFWDKKVEPTGGVPLPPIPSERKGCDQRIAGFVMTVIGALVLIAGIMGLLASLNKLDSKIVTWIENFARSAGGDLQKLSIALMAFGGATTTVGLFFIFTPKKTASTSI